MIIQYFIDFNVVVGGIDFFASIQLCSVAATKVLHIEWNERFSLLTVSLNSCILISAGNCNKLMLTNIESI